MNSHNVPFYKVICIKLAISGLFDLIVISLILPWFLRFSPSHCFLFSENSTSRFFKGVSYKPILRVVRKKLAQNVAIGKKWLSPE